MKLETMNLKTEIFSSFMFWP